jgi:transcriptional regulator with XRE-family HTH domain
MSKKEDAREAIILERDQFAVEMGRRISAARLAARMTGEELAKALGISRGTLSAWENGHGIPDAYGMYLICDVLKVEMDLFFDHTYDISESAVVGFDIAVAAKEIKVLRLMLPSIQDDIEKLKSRLDALEAPKKKPSARRK